MWTSWSISTSLSACEFRVYKTWKLASISILNLCMLQQLCICGINIVSYHNKSFIDISSDIIMRYMVVDLYLAMGRHWVADGDELQHPLNPNLRYSYATVNIMRAEWEFRITWANVLVELYREVNIKFPRRLAMRMPTDTLQLLQRA